MQAVTREKLLERASQLFENGTVSCALGWKRGEFAYDVTPAVFESFDEMQRDFVFDDFCGANFSKYLVSLCHKTEGKILVFLKPCDTYSFNQLLTEHRFERERVYAVGIPCNGMVDMRKIRNLAGEGIAGIECGDDHVTAHTLYDGDVMIGREACLAERCISCKSKKHVAYDELLGQEGEVLNNCRFDEVERIERMSGEERFAFWQGELSRCIRCNACRDVCPACTCEKCVFDNPASGVETKAPSDTFEEQMFHIIRAFHVAGRCTDCGECSRVCPQSIPLHLLNRKFIRDIDSFYGEYQAGDEVGSRAPLVNYTLDDLEASDATERSGEDA